MAAIVILRHSCHRQKHRENRPHVKLFQQPARDQRPNRCWSASARVSNRRPPATGSRRCRPGRRRARRCRRRRSARRRRRRRAGCRCRRRRSGRRCRRRRRAVSWRPLAASPEASITSSPPRPLMTSRSLATSKLLDHRPRLARPIDHQRAVLVDRQQDHVVAVGAR